MGEQYQGELREKIAALGAENLRVYINADGVHPHYYRHLQDTFQEAGVTFVASRQKANFVFEGNCEPVSMAGQIVAYFSHETLQFAGAI